jgi:hypothetical protein
MYGLFVCVKVAITSGAFKGLTGSLRDTTQLQKRLSMVAASKEDDKKVSRVIIVSADRKVVVAETQIGSIKSQKRKDLLFCTGKLDSPELALKPQQTYVVTVDNTDPAQRMEFKGAELKLSAFKDSMQYTIDFDVPVRITNKELEKEKERLSTNSSTSLKVNIFFKKGNESKYFKLVSSTDEQPIELDVWSKQGPAFNGAGDANAETTQEIQSSNDLEEEVERKLKMLLKKVPEIKCMPVKIDKTGTVVSAAGKPQQIDPEFLELADEEKLRVWARRNADRYNGKTGTVEIQTELNRKSGAEGAVYQIKLDDDTQTVVSVSGAQLDYTNDQVSGIAQGKAEITSCAQIEGRHLELVESSEFIREGYFEYAEHKVEDINSKHKEMASLHKKELFSESDLDKYDNVAHGQQKKARTKHQLVKQYTAQRGAKGAGLGGTNVTRKSSLHLEREIKHHFLLQKREEEKALVTAAKAKLSKQKSSAAQIGEKVLGKESRLVKAVGAVCVSKKAAMAAFRLAVALIFIGAYALLMIIWLLPLLFAFLPVLMVMVCAIAVFMGVVLLIVALVTLGVLLVIKLNPSLAIEYACTTIDNFNDEETTIAESMGLTKLM